MPSILNYEQIVYFIALNLSNSLDKFLSSASGLWYNEFGVAVMCHAK